LTASDDSSKAAGKKPDDASSTPPTGPSSTSSTKLESEPKSPSSLSLADIEALLSRIKEALRPSSPDSKSGSKAEMAAPAK
jgi:hypothetical protein